MMRVDEVKEEDASLLADDTSSGSLPQSLANSPLPQRRWSARKKHTHTVLVGDWNFIV